MASNSKQNKQKDLYKSVLNKIMTTYGEFQIL